MYVGAIFYNQTKQTCDEYMIQKQFEILELEINEPMVIRFVDGYTFTTSTVVDIDETDYGIWVMTTDKTYRFDDIKDL